MNLTNPKNLTKLEISVQDEIRKNPTATAETIAEAQKISPERAKKTINELESKGGLPNHFGLTKLGEHILLKAKESPHPPAHTRLIARVNLTTALSDELEQSDEAMMLRSEMNCFDDRIKISNLGEVDRPLSERMTNNHAKKYERIIVSNPDPSEQIKANWKAQLPEVNRVWVVKSAQYTSADFSKHKPTHPIAQGIVFYKRGEAELVNLGLAVRVACSSGVKGLTLTQAGSDLVERIKENIKDQPLQEMKKNHTPQKLLCPYCNEYLMQTTIYYVPGKPIIGNMFTAFGKAQTEGWNLGFGHSDPQLNCPGCGSSLLDPDGYLNKGRLYNINEDQQSTKSEGAIA